VERPDAILASILAIGVNANALNACPSTGWACKLSPITPQHIGGSIAEY